jgi:hypothetical protein
VGTTSAAAISSTPQAVPERENFPRQALLLLVDMYLLNMAFRHLWQHFLNLPFSPLFSSIKFDYLPPSPSLGPKCPFSLKS